MLSGLVSYMLSAAKAEFCPDDSTDIWDNGGLSQDTNSGIDQYLDDCIWHTRLGARAVKATLFMPWYLEGARVSYDKCKSGLIYAEPTNTV